MSVFLRQVPKVSVELLKQSLCTYEVLLQVLLVCLAFRRLVHEQLKRYGPDLLARYQLHDELVGGCLLLLRLTVLNLVVVGEDGLAVKVWLGSGLLHLLSNLVYRI